MEAPIQGAEDRWEGFLVAGGGGGLTGERVVVGCQTPEEQVFALFAYRQGARGSRASRNGKLVVAWVEKRWQGVSLLAWESQVEAVRLLAHSVIRSVRIGSSGTTMLPRTAQPTRSDALLLKPSLAQQPQL